MSIVTRAKRTVSPHVHRALDVAYAHRGRKAFLEAFEDARALGHVRVVIGSGRCPLPGWLNTDIVYGHVPSYLDATKPWPVPDNSVDLIYGDDVIEHVTLAEARLVFRYAFAALKPGGILRLATPDVEAVARQYLENGELAQLGMQRNAELGRPFSHPVELIREVFCGAKHYLGFCYDYDSLSSEMANAGFQPRRAPSGDSEHPELRGLEARTHPAERATGLIVEGVKPVDTVSAS